MAAKGKGNSGLWKETTAISKEVSKEGQIAHIIPGWECVHCNLKELELELIQTQMTQKPMLRAEVYARALRASQNRKEDSL